MAILPTIMKVINFNLNYKTTYYKASRDVSSAESGSATPLFEDEDDLYDPLDSLDCSVPDIEPSSFHPDHSSVFLSPPYSDTTFLSPSDTVSRCLPTEQHHLCKERKRSRKPSPAGTKRLTSTEQLDQFLARGCGCATKCSVQFDRDFYLSKRDEASALTREQLDLVVLGQIQAFLSVDEVIGPSHKHTPTQRRTTRVNTFYHLGEKICRGSFLTLHGIGKIIILIITK